MTWSAWAIISWLVMSALPSVAIMSLCSDYVARPLPGGKMRVVRYHTHRGKRNAFCGATPADRWRQAGCGEVGLGGGAATGVCSCPQLGWTSGQKYATTLLLYLPGDLVSTSVTLRASLIYEPGVTDAARDDDRLWFSV